MSDLPPMHLPGGELEQSLRALQPHVRFPPTPQLVNAVQARIANQQTNVPAPQRLPSWFRPRQVAVATVILLLIAIGLLAVFPGARSSIARRLGVNGIAIVFVDETPTPAASPVGAALVLGNSVTLTDAQAQVTFPIHLPAVYGAPEEVYLRTVPSGPIVTLLYLPRPELPVAEETGVGGLLMEFASTHHPADIAKRISMGAGSVQDVAIGDETGFWVTGESALVIYQDPTEDFEDFVSRDSANVLIWEQDGVTYRFESALPMDDAVRVAESLVPADVNATGQ